MQISYIQIVFSVSFTSYMIFKKILYAFSWAFIFKLMYLI